jgi:uncharacterized protein YbjT (DUF2867 family)
MSDPQLLLVAGSTGYVGTRLIPELVRRGYRVRALARRPADLRIRPWFDQVEVLPGDVLDASSLRAALEGVTSAYYLIHNMSGGRGYRSLEFEAASNFSLAAKEAGIRQIVYLGGLGEGSHHGHMESRHKAGEALRSAGVPVTEFRACVIIGTGSISFEMIRTAAHWFPLIPAPPQIDQWAQPISTPDLLRYLVTALDAPAAHGHIVEVGGPDKHLYPDMILECARQMGLRRSKLPVPIYPLELSARLMDMLSPVPLNIARPLMQELVGPSLVSDFSAADLFPDIRPMTYDAAVAHALAREEMPADGPWIGSLVTREPLRGPHVRTLGEGLRIEYREAVSGRTPQSLTRMVEEASSDGLESGWVLQAGRAGQWLRLQRPEGERSRVYLEVERREGLLRWAFLSESRGLPAHLVGLIRPARRLVPGS